MIQADELQNKFVAVLNKKIPVGSLMNALGHMAAGLSASYPNIPEMILLLPIFTLLILQTQ